MSEPRIVSSRQAYSGRLLRVVVEEVELDNGTVVELEMIRHPGAAAVVPVVSDASPDPEVLMIKQFRHAAGGTIWEIPAGVLGPDESPQDCAVRELEEETGARAARIEHLTSIYMTPGFTDEKIHLFLAVGLTLGKARPEQDEQIEPVTLPLSVVTGMIQDGTICDSKSIVGLQAARERLRF